jgi:hypothetical protein
MPTPPVALPEQVFVKLPAILKHTTYAIYLSLKGPNKERFLNAFAIARSRLAEYGYLSPDSAFGPVGGIKLTGAGRKRNNFHTNEGAVKNKRFDAMFRQFIQPPPKEPAEKRGG